MSPRLSNVQSFFCVAAISSCLLVARGASATAGELRISADETTVSILDGDKMLLRCHFADSPMKPCVDQLFTPAGVQVLRNSPPDHPHHHALMFALTVDKVNFWEENTPKCGKEQITGCAVIEVLTKDGIAHKNLIEPIRWIRQDSGELLMMEFRTIHAIKAADATLIEWHCRLQPPPGKKSITLTGNHYHGLGMRFVESMDAGSRFFNADDAPGEIVRGDERLTPTKWCAVTGNADGKPVTVAIFDHPQNTRYPAKMFTMAKPFAYLSATRNESKEPLTVAADKPLELTYGIAMWDGEVEKQTVEKLYQHWLKSSIQPKVAPNSSPTASTGAGPSPSPTQKPRPSTNAPSGELRSANAKLAQAFFSETVAPEKLKADLDHLFKSIKEIHPNMYAYISEAEFAVFRDELYRRVSHPMTRLQFYREVAPVVAKLKNGHTYVEGLAVPFDYSVPHYPMELKMVGEDLLVAKSDGPTRLPVGGKVLRIDGNDAHAAIARYASFHPAERRDACPALVFKQPLLDVHFWLDHADDETKTVRLRIRDAAGEEKDYAVEPIAPEMPTTAPANRSSSPYSYRRLPQANAGLLDIRMFDTGEQYLQFLRRTFKNIKEQGVQNLIIDIRGNSGGDSGSADELLKFLTDKPIMSFDKVGIKFSSQYNKTSPGELKMFQTVVPEAEEGAFVKFDPSDFTRVQPSPPDPLRFKGRTFVLMDGAVASSSEMFASSVRRLGIGKLVGSEAADPMAVYGQGFRVTLPNTRLTVAIACKYFRLAGGKDDGRGVLPDHAVTQTPEDTAKGIDTVLQFTLELMKKR
jgi:hypothetical protein